MTDSRLTFDEPSHTYLLDGKPINSVTQIMDGLLSDYCKVPRDVLAHAAARGTAVHKAAELWLQDDLDETSLHHEVAPYFYQFVKWYRKSGFVAKHSEIKVFSEKYWYAGALDLFGELKKADALIDIKTSRKLMPATGPQLAAYEEAYRERTGSKKKILRFGLHLTPESYELVPMTDTADRATFLSCLALNKWRIKHGYSS